jgi:ACS family hexuronate transporter-like MFS transporter
MDGSEMQTSQQVERMEKGQSQTLPKGRGFSWLIALLLLSSMGLNYLDRASLSVLVRFLPPALKMSNVTYANITSAFLVAYAAALPLTGWLVDLLGTRIGLAIMVSCWSVFQFLSGTARSVFMLGVFRFLLGIPEAASLPTISKVAAEHAAPHARATLIGIAMFGTGMGTTFAPPIVAFLFLHSSWRWAFYCTGLVGFVWVLSWLLFYRTQLSAAALSRAPEMRMPWVTLLSDRRVIGLALTHLFSGAIWWFYLFWIPPFLNQQRHLDIREIGIYGWIPFFFASIGSVFGGYASGYLVRRGSEPVRARKTIMWVSACIVPFTSFFVVRVPGLAAVLTFLAVATFFIQAFFSNLHALPADLFPHERVASVAGLTTMFSIVAAIATVQFTGHAVDRSFAPAFALVAFFLPAGAVCAQWLIPSKAEATSRPSL